MKYINFFIPNVDFFHDKSQLFSCTFMHEKCHLIFPCTFMHENLTLKMPIE